MVVAWNCERMVQAKLHGDETACAPHSLMAVVYLLEEKKLRHMCCRNGHDCGHPTISKSEGLAETVA